jgi:hypothetical protein
MLVLDSIVDLYGSVIPSSPTICALIKRIRRKSREEIEFMKEMQAMMGTMEMLLGFAENMVVRPTEGLDAEESELVVA